MTELQQLRNFESFPVYDVILPLLDRNRKKGLRASLRIASVNNISETQDAAMKTEEEDRLLSLKMPKNACFLGAATPTMGVRRPSSETHN